MVSARTGCYEGSFFEHRKQESKQTGKQAGNKGAEEKKVESVCKLKTIWLPTRDITHSLGRLFPRKPHLLTFPSNVPLYALYLCDESLELVAPLPNLRLWITRPHVQYHGWYLYRRSTLPFGNTRKTSYCLVLFFKLSLSPRGKKVMLCWLLHSPTSRDTKLETQGSDGSVATSPRVFDVIESKDSPLVNPGIN